MFFLFSRKKNSSQKNDFCKQASLVQRLIIPPPIQSCLLEKSKSPKSARQKKLKKPRKEDKGAGKVVK
jgi:hypothetical protein